MTPAVILLAPVLLLAGLAWWRLEQALAAFPLLFPDGTYLQLDAIVAVIGVWLMAGSFLLSRRWPSPARARVSLLFASIVLSFACVDAYVVLVRTDTSGPGGASSITMRRWFERYVTPHVNANGYWERDFRQATAGNLRPLVIAVVGDSMTWGQGC
jgi:hypothetical protein